MPDTGPLLFVYRHSAMRSESDDLRDAILLFHPPHTPIARQCLLAGQLMGLTGFIRYSLRTQPAVFELDSGLRLACVHSQDGDLTLCVGIGGGVCAGDTSAREVAARLHKSMQLLLGPLALTFESAPKHSADLQASLSPLVARLLALHYPQGCPHGLLGFTSGHVSQVSLTPPPPLPRKQQQQQEKAEKLNRQRRSRLLLAADCLADRAASCLAGRLACNVLGCAVFLNGSFLTSSGLPTWLCAALSTVLTETAPDSPLRFVDPGGGGGGGGGDGGGVKGGIQAVAFHAFVPAEDVSATCKTGRRSCPFGGRHLPSLSSLCQAAVILDRLSRQPPRPLLALAHSSLSSSMTLTGTVGGVVHCQCGLWTTSLDDRTCLSLAVLFAPSACVGCARDCVAPLLSPTQLRTLALAFAAAADSDSPDDVKDDDDAKKGLPLIHCPPVLPPAAVSELVGGGLGRVRFPDDSTQALAALIAAAVDAASGDSASLAMSVRVDGRLRVSAARSDGLLTVSDRDDLTMTTREDVGVGGGNAAVFPRRRRLGTVGNMLLPRVSVSPPMPPPLPAAPRRTRSLIWRKSSRGL